jgi:hypothetical protein
VEKQENLAKKGHGLASDLEKSQRLLEAKDLEIKLAAKGLAVSQDLTAAGVSDLESKISEHQIAIDATQKKFDLQNEKLELINENCLD